MEASLLDLTRRLDRHADHGVMAVLHALDAASLEVEIVFDHTPIEDVLADTWFATHDDDVPVASDEAVVTPSGRGLQAIMCFGIAVLLAACLHASAL